ncbi:MAG: hypothetical protein AABZ02_03250 [Bacteroidota bacterium]|jgi:hypothetical protein
MADPTIISLLVLFLLFPLVETSAQSQGAKRVFLWFDVTTNFACLSDAAFIRYYLDKTAAGRGWSLVHPNNLNWWDVLERSMRKGEGGR